MLKIMYLPNVIISSEVGSWRFTTLGLPMLIECLSICDLNLAHESKLMVQRHKRFRRTLFIMTNHSIRTFGVTPFFKPFSHLNNS